MSTERRLGGLIRIRPLLGTFIKLPRPEVVEVIADAGFDFVICDMEHAQIAEVEARVVIRAGTASRIPVVVRIPDPSPGVVNRLLEAGAAAIQVPRITRLQDVKALRAMTRFPPGGSRSVGTANQAAQFGRMPVSDYVAERNQGVLIVGQIETADTEAALESLFAELDVVFIGPVDLAVAMGFPGDSRAAAVTRRIEEIEIAARKTNAELGSFASSVDDAKELIRRGYRYVALAGDISFLAASARAAVRELSVERQHVAATDRG